MKREVGSKIRTLSQITAVTVLCLWSGFGMTVQAQQGAETPEQDALKRQLFDRMFESEQREENRVLLLMIERFHKSARPSRQTRPPFAQIREDYVRLQVVNNSLAQSAVTSDTPDLKLVAGFTAEIERLARRLKKNLLLPEIETCKEPQKVIVGPEVKHLRAATAALYVKILRMVRNPLFKSPGLFDPRFALQLGCELEVIIELSSQLKTRSKQLSKEEHSNS